MKVTKRTYDYIGFSPSNYRSKGNYRLPFYVSAQRGFIYKNNSENEPFVWLFVVAAAASFMFILKP